MSGSEGGCWKSGTLCMQLAGFLPDSHVRFLHRVESSDTPSTVTTHFKQLSHINSDLIYFFFIAFLLL